MRTIILWLLFHTKTGNDIILHGEIEKIKAAQIKRITKQNKRVKK